MTKLAKTKAKSLKKTEPVERPFQAGDMLISPQGDLRKVGKVTKKGFEMLSRQNGEWRHYSDCEWDGDRETRRFVKLEKPIEEYEADLMRELQTGFSSFESGPASSGTEVALSSGENQARAAKLALEQTTRTLSILEGMLARKKHHLESIKRSFEDQLEKISRVVDIIELYLGISEEIVQIAEGDPAPIEEPLCIRQLCLHMNEEAADLFTGKRDGRGRHVDDIDFTNIDKFDDWAREHTDQLIPEKKGIVVCRPRRTEKDYRLGEDPLSGFTASEMNKENFRTYYLIRNGANLYRISSDKLHVYPVLFPSKEEFTRLTNGKNESFEWGADRKKQRLLAYQRNVLMLQGLIDRTQMFRPMPAGVNLLQPETFGNSVKFIHDAESLLGTGRPDFFKWLEQLNSKLKRGDRLYFTEYPWGLFGRDDAGERSNRFPIPGWDKDRPKAGVYNIARVETFKPWSWKEEGPSFICHFNPKDKIYGGRDRWGHKTWDPHERKMSIPFRLYPYDHFIINYEALEASDVDFYLKDRVNRKNYLEMIPILRGIMAQKKEEKLWEDNFVQFFQGKFKRDDTEFRALVEEAVHFWKNKVIQKRPLKKEDAKAVRMISDYVRRRVKALS